MRFLFSSMALAVVILLAPSRLLAAPIGNAKIDPVTDINKWLPEGPIEPGGEELGNTFDANVSWIKTVASGPDDPFYMAVAITDVSHYTGFAGNRGERLEVDLILRAADNPAWDVAPDGRSAVSKAKVAARVTIPLTVRSRDWAAKGTLGAAEGFHNAKGEPDFGHFGATVTPASLSIPKDTDGDDLPDIWEKVEKLNPDVKDSDGDGTPDGDEDDEDNPHAVPDAGPANPPGSRTALGVSGDGLTAWEEYRGFIILNKTLDGYEHTRLHPGLKDLFLISNILKIGATAELPDDPERGHLGSLEQLPLKRLIQIDLEVVGGDKTPDVQDLFVNVNNDGIHASTRQRALRLTERKDPVGVPDGDLGLTVLRSTFATATRDIIHTGDDGKAQVSAGGDDEQLIPVGQGLPFGDAIIPGSSGVLMTQPGGDDRIILNVLTTGENGILDSVKDPADVFKSGGPTVVGNGVPGTVSIDVGKNGKLDTLPASGDLQDTRSFPDTPMSPNETLECRIFRGRIQEAPTTLDRTGLLNAIVAHEGGHGMHIDHYRPGERLRGKTPTISFMVSPMNQLDKLPRKFDDPDIEQIRLHLKHE